jgi:transposase
MRAYSMDLRERVVAAVDRGTPRKEIVRTLGVSEPTIRRYLRLRRETGSLWHPSLLPNVLSPSPTA